VPLSGLLAFASVNLGARAVPIVASVVLHAGIAAGLVATASGHARAGNAPPAIEMTVDVETLEPITPTVPVPVPEPEPARNVAAPTHTHPYPVDPSHDARPHDPSLVHDHHDHDDHHAQPEAAPAPAAPALVAEPAAVLPTFDLGSGSGAPAGSKVAAQAPADGALRGGSGAGAGPSTSAASTDDVVHAATAVQVPARLVHSAAPAYPAYARADDVEGDVGVEIVVDREGRVAEARVTAPAGHGFDAAALAAIRAYRFSPAQRDGHAVRVRMPWSVQFRLR
jgi:protein TonB